MKYLVLVTCGSDDFPVLITEDRNMAIEYANEIKDRVPDHVLEVFGMDASYTICTKLIEFNGVDKFGLHPTNCESIMSFDADPTV
jgi:hypothetical protein